jgi:carbonic anhydrase
MMDRLYRGVKKFREEHYKKNKDYYQELSKGQSPDTLFITCSDSRVDPNLLTSSKPGELFIVKNVGNIIPTETTPWKKTCIATAIEYAISVLKVSHIVICGHCDCGAMKALNMDLREFLEMPNLRDWLETARPKTSRHTP